jgi:phospholipid/cholesterol/gamma-HCH transport system permease protein
MPATEPKLPLGTVNSGVLIRLQDLAKRWVLAAQTYALLAARSVTNIFTPPHYITDLLEQMDVIGVGSLPIAVFSGVFIGAVTVLQTAAQFARYGQTQLTGDVVAVGLVRELGPTITGLLVAGRNASGIASELGSLLVAIADFSGLVGGFIISSTSQHLGAVQFWTRAINALDFSDLMQGMIKPIVFGFILATIGCYHGLTVRGGTQGVGRATTQAVVASSILILLADFFLDKLLLFLSGHIL